MAFTLEDGTGVAGANAYIPTAFADGYFSDRGVTAWTGSDTVKQQAIIRATDYVEKRFTGRWRGSKATPAQGLSWPRLHAEDDEGFDLLEVPLQLKQAISEYALRALTAALLPDPEVTTSGTVVRERSKVGPVEEEFQYSEAGATLIQAYPAADRLLRGLIRSAQGRIERA